MIQKLKNKLMIVASLFVLGTPMLMPAVASAAANVTDNLCTGANFNVTGQSQNGAGCGTQTGQSFNDLLTKIVNIISASVGVVAVIMIIVGGFKYITSGGESSNVSGAKNTIIYAIIGLVIVALAQVIVRFVINSVPT